MSKKNPELERLAKRKELTMNNMTYNLQRLDLLIISVCGAGIYADLELSKFLFEQKFCSCTLGTFKIPAVLFITAIIFNLISQYTGYRSNKYDYLLSDEQMYYLDKEEDDISKATIAKLDKNANVCDLFTTVLNLLSLVLLIIGLILLIFFFSRLTF